MHAALDGREVHGRPGGDNRLVVVGTSGIWDGAVLGPVDAVGKRQLRRPEISRQPCRNSDGCFYVAAVSSRQAECHDAALRVARDDRLAHRWPAR